MNKLLEDYVKSLDAKFGNTNFVNRAGINISDLGNAEYQPHHGSGYVYEFDEIATKPSDTEEIAAQETIKAIDRYITDLNANKDCTLIWRIRPEIIERVDFEKPQKQYRGYFRLMIVRNGKKVEESVKNE